MPIYEYRCTSCGHEKEVLQKLSDPPLTECPACGKATLGKLVSAAGFQLKGSGWYATDFKGGTKSKPKDGMQETHDKSESKDKSENAEKSGSQGKLDAQPREPSKTNEGAKAGKERASTETSSKASVPVTTAGKSD